MAKKKADPVVAAGPAAPDTTTIPAEAGSKLRKLIIKNLGCIGNTPVSIDLDDIVVLVGRNNTGKSTILRAYQVLVASPKPKLTIDDFPNRTINPAEPPQIELHTQVFQNLPGHRWIGTVNSESIIRERWTWNQPGEGSRQGFDVIANAWSDQVPWGAANVANSRRPTAHRIEAFSTPENQITEVVKLLVNALQTTIKAKPRSVKDEAGEETMTDYGNLLDGLGKVQKAIVAEVKEQIDHAQSQLTEIIKDVFQGYRIEFDAKAEEDLSSCINFFKSGATLRMGPENGHLSPAENQGSGARRTLMWAALKYTTEHSSGDAADQKHLLLLDEPELCLHPNAIREACKVLYDLPAKGRWQVMVTTHSPAFIDLTRDNTTIVRVERDQNGHTISGTTVFRPSQVQLSQEEKETLKMLNYCDPHLGEFFFGGKTIIVEGDTEFTGFRFILDHFKNDPKLKDVHVVRARGKASICLVAKIFNQFNARYAVLHDCDSPSIIKKKRNSTELVESVNPAWSNNFKILECVKHGKAAGRVRLVASVPHFELAFYGEEFEDDKPWHTWVKLGADEAVRVRVKELLYSLLDFAHPVPAECSEWADEAGLKQRFQQFHATV